MNYYSDIEPIGHPIAAQRQGTKRHYGVHPYFTRRPSNVVREYILRFSKDKDVVLDPFGGSGVTAIEAFLVNRSAIHNDINPLANFIAKGIVGLSEGNLYAYTMIIEHLKKVCQPTIHRIENGDTHLLHQTLRSLSIPQNILLPANSDVEHYFDLFTPEQLACLTILRTEIDKIPEKYCRSGMLLAWSASLAKLNKTFLSTRGRASTRGGSSIFSIYRYKIAKTPVELPTWEIFEERANNIVVAKKEIDKAIRSRARTTGWFGTFELRSKDIGDLRKDFENKIDYIFTDPPYGGNISYLDLSVLWNNWLSEMPSNDIRKKEIIVGGELQHTEEEYIQRLYDSISDCIRMLKSDRWLSVVFQHWNVRYFQAILDAARDAGAELKAAVSQVGDPIWSMHKKKNRESVLSGEMILTFHKSGKHIYQKNRLDFDVEKAVGDVLSSVKTGFIYGEYLFNRIILEAWNKGTIDSLSISKDLFAQIIQGFGWYYDPQHHYWSKGTGKQDSLF